MPLTMRATGLKSPVDVHRQDYTIFSAEWAMGRIYEQRGGPEHMRWFWSLFGIFGKPADLRTDGHAATLDEAKAQFETESPTPDWKSSVPAKCSIAGHPAAKTYFL